MCENKLDRKKLIEIIESWKRVLDDDNRWNKAGWEDEQAHEQIKELVRLYGR